MLELINSLNYIFLYLMTTQCFKIIVLKTFFFRIKNCRNLRIKIKVINFNIVKFRIYSIFKMNLNFKILKF